jgi:signal transduction histidine kinase
MTLSEPVPGGNKENWRCRTRWLEPAVYAGVLVAFIADIFEEIFYIPFGLLYLPLVCTAVFRRDPRAAWWLAAVASVMVMVGFFLPIIPPHMTTSLVSRGLSITAIFTTAALVRYARDIQEQLAAETARAEAAERVKTDVFTTLSEEMRTPLHTMVALSEVMIAGCRPDQRLPLQQVQGGSKRLLATIENMIDLTNLDERPIAPETVDVNRMIRQAADASRQLAWERQIAVELDLPKSDLTAHADPWAVRRILDNLIANAVKFSPAGSTVELAAEQRSRSVALVVRDTGIGMSADIVRRLGEPFFQDHNGIAVSGTGTGLALCRRLARAMGAELAFDSELGNGTTAVLELPA